MNVEPLCQECIDCGWLGLPKRLWCPKCGGEAWNPVLQARGTVAAITVIHRSISRDSDPRQIVLVHLDAGWMIAAAAVQFAMGDQVLLMRQGNTVIATPTA